MKRNAAAVLCVFLFAGCYTQFAYVNRAALEGVPPDSALPADSASAYIRDSVPANPNQVCYWTRDMWGRPQLVCEDADYGRDWYRYNYYPWWNRSDPYFYGSYNSYGWDERCPAYYYYDYSCGACRYYSGYEGTGNSWWWNSPSASGRPAVGTGTAHPRRSRSSGVQANPGTSGTPLNKRLDRRNPAVLRPAALHASSGQGLWRSSEHPKMVRTRNLRLSRNFRSSRWRMSSGRWNSREQETFNRLRISRRFSSSPRSRRLRQARVRTTATTILRTRTRIPTADAEIRGVSDEKRDSICIHCIVRTSACACRGGCGFDTAIR